jgi:hypothetical protein
LKTLEPTAGLQELTKICQLWTCVHRVSESCRIDSSLCQLYIVHMKHVTASEARRNWFALLDEAAKGEVIAIQRNDKKLVLKLQTKKSAAPSYKGLIDFPDADIADTWGWEWKGPGKLVPKRRRTSKR